MIETKLDFSQDTQMKSYAVKFSWIGYQFPEHLTHTL